MAADEVVVGATRRDLLVVLLDAFTGDPIDMTGGTAVLEGKSPDLPAVAINGNMTVQSGPAGEVRYSGLGGLVTHAQLVAANIKSALYRCRVRYTVGGKTDWGPEFELEFKDTPLGT